MTDEDKKAAEAKARRVSVNLFRDYWTEEGRCRVEDNPHLVSKEDAKIISDGGLGTKA